MSSAQRKKLSVIVLIRTSLIQAVSELSSRSNGNGMFEICYDVNGGVQVQVAIKVNVNE